MTRLLVVTGVSCAGKTTLGRALNEHPDVSGWTDLDEHAQRPVTGWLDWLRWRAATVLHDVTGDPGDRLHVVSGIVWPFRLVESPAWRPAVKAGVRVRWLMLDPPWKVLRARLDERCADRPAQERRELRRYNRDLRRTLREQIDVLGNGARVGDLDLTELVACASASW